MHRCPVIPHHPILSHSPTTTTKAHPDLSLFPHLPHPPSYPPHSIGVVTTMVYPVGSSTGGNCYPVMNTYLSQALNLYNLGVMSFSPMCMFVNAMNPGIPVEPIYANSAIVESVYQSSVGCAADSIFQLPDNWKAFLQTPLLTSRCASASSSSSSSSVQKRVLPLTIRMLSDK